MDVFSQTTTRESTEVPKRLFSPATALSVTGPLTGFVIRSLQTNSSGKHTVPNFAFVVYPRVLLRPCTQKRIYFLSQTIDIELIRSLWLD